MSLLSNLSDLLYLQTLPHLLTFHLFVIAVHGKSKDKLEAFSVFQTHRNIPYNPWSKTNWRFFEHKHHMYIPVIFKDQQHNSVVCVKTATLRLCPLIIYGSFFKMQRKTCILQVLVSYGQFWSSLPSCIRFFSHCCFQCKENYLAYYLGFQRITASEGSVTSKYPVLIKIAESWKL